MEMLLEKIEGEYFLEIVLSNEDLELIEEGKIAISKMPFFGDEISIGVRIRTIDD
jgi:hypothetical protein